MRVMIEKRWKLEKFRNIWPLHTRWARNAARNAAKRRRLILIMQSNLGFMARFQEWNLVRIICSRILRRRLFFMTVCTGVKCLCGQLVGDMAIYLLLAILAIMLTIVVKQAFP